MAAIIGEWIPYTGCRGRIETISKLLTRAGWGAPILRGAFGLVEMPAIGAAWLKSAGAS